ncbi:carboxypeptidase-like regulatory domain-containing protein [Flagellimonas myxillae]|uniref:carboxypeptidase-like regulatory domain-containing protein n=1 Tax=Flagellimonas myxillae TaxID=2942214 RepID=UPI00201F3473|nr:carboxypeptidase-like regulatory domain-containing protein [Muricauda myxillae]MCL6266726.1 TonB-dependent receptor plug domain-containing protein [Muricauda myxillae]
MKKSRLPLTRKTKASRFPQLFAFFFLLMGQLPGNTLEHELLNAGTFEHQLAQISVNPTPQQINGKVIDQNTGEPIPYCNIAVELSVSGTSSNELGEFVVAVDSLPTKIIFSHISYEKKVVELSEASDLVITLEPLTHNLDEITLTASKDDSFAKSLARKAFQKAIQNVNRPHYGKAFYRQKSKNGDMYSEFSEIIYDIRYNNGGIDDWEIIEGRYALNPGGVHNKNFTLLSRLITPLQPATDELIFPMHPDLTNFYNLSIIDHITSGNTKIAVIDFKPKKGLGVPIFEAEVYIDVASHDILKIVGNVLSDDIKLVRLSEKNGSWKKYNISYEIAYKKDSLQNLLLDYVNLKQSFDYYINDSFKFHTTSSSNLVFFEHYFPLSRKRLGGSNRINKSDWDRLDEIGYNEKFWAENPIVKRTPVEEDVISAFENDEAFGSIFLNSKENIALMGSNLAKDPFIKQLSHDLRSYKDSNPVEKVYLHTDKRLFSPGEDLWYSGYVVLGSHHQFTTGSKVLYVDLIDPDNNIVSSQTHEIREGKAFGTFKIPDGATSGNYHLRAYTNWMRNYDQDFLFSKTIKIVDGKVPAPISSSSEDKIDLQFFPEGGHLVANLTCRIAFKAIGGNGQDLKLSGKILDSQSNYLATLSTIDRGAGFFSLQPKAGEEYVAVLSNGQTYPLPQILAQGYVVTVTNTSQKSVEVKVQSEGIEEKEPFYVVGHVNGKKYYQGKFHFGKKQLVSFEIPKSKLPSGVMTLTLFDSEGRPRCERVVFINNEEELFIYARVNPKDFGKRDAMAVDIFVSDPNGKPVSGEFSIAITDAGQVTKSQSTSNILTHLLMESDVKGHIENPGLLFSDQKKSTLHKLDLVMLTHGWRKLPWQDIKTGVHPAKPFPFEKGITLVGMARTVNNNPLQNTNLNAIARADQDSELFLITTNQDGSFTIPDFNLNGPTDFAFSALNRKNKTINFNMTLKKGNLDVPLASYRQSYPVNLKEAEKYTSVTTARKNTLSFFDAQNVTLLDEVVVTEKKMDPISPSRKSLLGQEPDATLYADKNKSAHTVIDLVQRFPGVTVTGNPLTLTAAVSIRNQGTPLWVVNGIPVHNENIQPRLSGLAANDSLDPGAMLAQTLLPVAAPSYIQTMDSFTVERVELLKGPSAVIYGSRGANGVILVFTKRGGDDYGPEISSPDFTIPGHAVEREFYSPKYDVPAVAQKVPDYRATLYWNPSFKTNKTGNARLLFYNSDHAKDIQVSIEGLSNYGLPGSYLQVFGKRN